jgi:hypothetical protein
VEASDYNCKASIKGMWLFEEIFREMEALIRNLRLFERLAGRDIYTSYTTRYIYFSS